MADEAETHIPAANLNNAMDVNPVAKLEATEHAVVANRAHCRTVFRPRVSA